MANPFDNCWPWSCFAPATTPCGTQQPVNGCSTTLYPPSPVTLTRATSVVINGAQKWNIDSGPLPSTSPASVEPCA